MILTTMCSASLAQDRGQGEERSRYSPQLLKQGDVIRHPTWGVVITIPNFEYWTDNSMQAQANYILGATSSGECNLTLSMFVENDKNDVTPEQCRRGYMGNPDKLRKQRDVRIIEESVAPLTYTLFEKNWSSAGVDMTQNQLYGYWTRGRLCFELHISAMMCDPGSFARQAKPILESVGIGPDTGATLETVDLALHGGPDPLGWEAHMLVASIYLHRTDPPEPARARSFYGMALRLGGESIPTTALYLIEAGIGIAWLLEDRGAEAIPHLEQALTAALQMPQAGGGSGSPSRQESLDETVFNLICAHTLAGNASQACDRARELLTPLDASARREKVREFREDKQLKKFLKSDCYELLEDELDLE